MGVTLSPKTSLELPVPSNLLDQGSSTDVSMYFNTNQSNANALLFYLGNEGTSRQKRDVTRKLKTVRFIYKYIYTLSSKLDKRYENLYVSCRTITWR